MVDNIRWDALAEWWPQFLQGAVTTVEITVVAVVCGTLLGLFAGLGRLARHPLVRLVPNLYVTFMRGTPLFVQILLMHYAVMPALFGSNSAIVNGIIALSLNAGAYIAEIVRAGIQSIDPGQREAGRSLGLTQAQTMRHIILPQAFRRMLPPLGNEAIMLLKDSSLCAAIALPEITYYAKAMQGSTYLVWESFLSVALLYLVLTILCERLVRLLERRYGTV